MSAADVDDHSGDSGPIVGPYKVTREYTIGTELQRSDTLAIVQLLILYHLATAKAAVALGGNGTRRLAAAEPVAP